MRRLIKLLKSNQEKGKMFDHEKKLENLIAYIKVISNIHIFIIISKNCVFVPKKL